jgi:hypothetical protein
MHTATFCRSATSNGWDFMPLPLCEPSHHGWVADMPHEHHQ